MSKDIAVIERYAGRANVDIRAGWETGLLGKQRVGGQLFDRLPPEHLKGQRSLDWRKGQEAAAKFLATRRTHFQYAGKDGLVEFWRKGHADRHRVVKSLRDKGVFVDIRVTYLEDGEIMKTVDCGY